MTIQIGRYNFEGPFDTLDGLPNASGVYAILGRNASGGYDMIDIGESATLKDRIATHDRKDQWARRGHPTILAAAYYSDAHSRMHIEQELRALYNPPCGLR